MAGHLPIKPTEDIKLFHKLNEILKIMNFKIMIEFQKVKVCGVTIQRLSEEYKMDEGDDEIFSIMGWDFKSEEFEHEDCIIEVHLTKEGKINQIYFVA